MSTDTLNVRGPLPAYIVETLGIDEHGILAGSIKIPHRVGTDNQKIDPTWLTKVPDPGWGIPLFNSQSSIGEGGICWVTANFKGIGPTQQNDLATTTRPSSSIPL
jgi:hypothetical protein